MLRYACALGLAGLTSMACLQTAEDAEDGDSMLARRKAVTSGNVIVFGGEHVSQPNGNVQITQLADTWQWNGSSWLQKVSATAPKARTHAAMAFDSDRKKVVLFGGDVDSENRVLENDTWEWNGASWAQAQPKTQPPKRFHHAMVYDRARKKVVLFGGNNGEISAQPYLSDTWEWDGASWTQKSPPRAPSARSNAAMAYDDQSQRVVLFGGFFQGELGDTWEWDGASWSEKTSATAPSARSDAAMAYDSSRKKLILFGGMHEVDGTKNDTWQWDGSAWTQLSPASSPPARDGFAMASDSALGKVVLFSGGGGPNALADTWEWNGSTWSKRQGGGAPPSRHGHVMVGQ
jgi:hypothetical protein